MLVDYHVHTEFSDDSNYEMEQVVQDATALGINELCFTDHVDYGIKRDWDDPRGIERRKGTGGELELMYLANVDYPRYFEKFQFLRERYWGKIQLKFGLEFGVQVHTIPQFQTLFAKYPFDFIILSIHQVEDKEFWNQRFQENRTQQEFNERYYKEMFDVIKNYKSYSVLGHLDLIVRYDKLGTCPFKKIEPFVAEILKMVIADGKGIEINTSSFRYGLRDLTPSRDILRLYKDLGGKILTIGSDCHKKEHLGSRIVEIREELKRLGFNEFCTFDKMKPSFHSL